MYIHFTVISKSNLWTVSNYPTEIHLNNVYISEVIYQTNFFQLVMTDNLLFQAIIPFLQLPMDVSVNIYSFRFLSVHKTAFRKIRAYYKENIIRLWDVDIILRERNIYTKLSHVSSHVEDFPKICDYIHFPKTFLRSFDRLLNSSKACRRLLKTSLFLIWSRSCVSPLCYSHLFDVPDATCVSCFEFLLWVPNYINEMKIRCYVGRKHLTMKTNFDFG